MAVQDWSSTASLNVTIDGINIAEECLPGNMNDGLRSIMASVKVMYDNLPSTATLAPLASPVFTGVVKQSGKGAFLYHNDGAFGSGKVHLLADGTAYPASPANGDLVFFYQP